ncbi:MAG: hypothetical protein AB7S68_24085 [Polyangiaceae bacterium]
MQSRARHPNTIRGQKAAPVLLVQVLIRVYQPVVRRAARATLEGRRWDPKRPQAGRFLRDDVDDFLEEVWHRVALVAQEENWGQIPTLGNRHNVFLGVLTIAAFHALIERGVQKDYAVQLFADVGWKVYERLLRVPLSLARLLERDPQKRMNLVLEALMRFPFSAPGAPGYEVRAWRESDSYHTHWSYCAPLGFVKRYAEAHGDRGEVEAFFQSWCQYDWPAADLIAGAKLGERGHYQRPHTLSQGDSVCDMCWSASRSCKQR